MKAGATTAGPRIVARAGSAKPKPAPSRAAPRPKPEALGWQRARKVWYALLGVWMVLLSGGFAPWLGTPGVIQQVRLQGLLSAREAELARLQAEIDRLREESAALEKSKAVQHREIRKVLGYAADDEIVFDFGSPAL